MLPPAANRRQFVFVLVRRRGRREAENEGAEILRAVVHSRIMAKEQEVASAERLAAEGGIASDESAFAELEIETNEGPAEEHNERS